MRRMRSLQLLQTPPKCVTQLSVAVCVVPTAVREDDALGLAGEHRWTAASSSCLCRHVKFSRRSRDTPPYGGAMPPIHFSNNSNKRLTYPGSGFASRSVRTSVRLEAQRQPSENECAGAWYQGRAIAETAAKLQG